MANLVEVGTLQKRMETLEEKLDLLIATIEKMEFEVMSMKQQVSETREIAAAWKSVKLGAAFLKWAGGLVTSAGVVFAAWKGWMK